MIIDWNSGTYDQRQVYVDTVWNWSVVRTITEVQGQWSNVLLLESNQPTMELTGQEWLTLGSNQERYTVELN